MFRPLLLLFASLLLLVLWYFLYLLYLSVLSCCCCCFYCFVFAISWVPVAILAFVGLIVSGISTAVAVAFIVTLLSSDSCLYALSAADRCSNSMSMSKAIAIACRIEARRKIAAYRAADLWLPPFDKTHFHL